MSYKCVFCVRTFLKARSHGAIFFVNATAIENGLCGCQ